MSYDFDLVRLLEGCTPSEEAVSVSLEREAEARDEPAVPAREERKRQLAEALRALNPQLSIHVDDFAVIAQMQGISEEEARHRKRSVELNGPEDGNGIQIVLFDESAAVTIPYWHIGEKADSTLQEAWRYLDLLRREGGFITWDSQVGRILDLSTDFGLVLQQYAQGVTFVRRKATEGLPGKRPWWRFW